MYWVLIGFELVLCPKAMLDWRMRKLSAQGLCMLNLRDFQMRDMPHLLQAIVDEKMLMQFAGPAYVFPLTAAQVVVDLHADNVRVFSMVTAADEVVGHAQMQVLSDSVLLRRILIWDESWRGQGWGQQMVRQLLEVAFAIPEVKQARLNVFAWNTPAIRCYQRLGFVMSVESAKTVSVAGETWQSVGMVCVKPVR